MGLTEVTIATLRRIMLPLEVRLRNSITRAVLAKVDDERKMQEVQLRGLKGEIMTAVERMQEYGFSSVPPEGGEALAVFVGGDRAHGIVVATDDRRHRPTGDGAGDVRLYCRQLGLFLHLDDSSSKMALSGDTVEVDGVNGITLDDSTRITLQVGASSIVIETGKITITTADLEINTP